MSARQFGTTATIFTFPFLTAFPDRACVVAGKFKPENFTFYFPASFAFFGKRGTFNTSCTTRRRVEEIVFPIPPSALADIGIFRIDEIFQSAIEIKLATIYGATAQTTFLII